VRSYDYDRYGNLLQSADPASATTTYAYDEANRLKTISPPGGAATQITFTLDALDRHATRLLNGATTDTYGYLDATETAWQTGQATTTAALLDADGTRLAVKTGSTVSWLVFDLHGSVVALCPSTGSTLSDAYRFDGWGQQIASAGSATNPWRYRGLLNVGSDALTGALLDMAARHYSPQLGVFTQQDSVQGSAANPATMNRFLYAHANPATLIDPDGHAIPTAMSYGGGGGGAIPWATPPVQFDLGRFLVGAIQTTAAVAIGTLLSPFAPREPARNIWQLSKKQAQGPTVYVDDLAEREAAALDTVRGAGDRPPQGGGSAWCRSVKCRLFTGVVGIVGTQLPAYLLTGRGNEGNERAVPRGSDAHSTPRATPSPAASPQSTSSRLTPFMYDSKMSKLVYL
jgi:RHS repeat-associated protein